MIRKTFWLAGALSLVLAACDDDDDDGLVNPPATTSVSVALTSTSGDVVSSVVTIEQIMLQGTGVTRVDLLDAPVTVNLTDLANATQEIVTAADITNGTYSDIRMVITGAFVELSNPDGTTTIYASAEDYAGLPEGAVVGGALTLPANPLDGAVIDFDENVSLDGGQVTLLIDFDLVQSVIDDGAGGFNLTPFIRGGIGADAGTVAVTLGLGDGITLPDGTTLANFSATLGGKRLVFTDNNGTFTSSFAHVLPGTYTLNLIGPDGLTFTTDPTVPLDVTVAAAGNVTQAISITEATAGTP